MRLITTPLLIIIVFLFFIGPVLFAVLSKPQALISPKTYYNFVSYMFSAIPTFLASIIMLFVHYLPPSYYNSVGETIEGRDYLLKIL